MYTSTFHNGCLIPSLIVATFREFAGEFEPLLEWGRKKKRNKVKYFHVSSLGKTDVTHYTDVSSNNGCNLLSFKIVSR